MKRTTLCISIGICSFLIGIGIVFFIYSRPTYDLKTGKSICQKCVDISKAESIETKSLSEIFNDKDVLGKKFRVKVLFNSDTNYIHLYDINDKKLSIRGGFDKNQIACTDTDKTLQVCSGYNTWYDSSVYVTVIGYVGKIDKEINKYDGNEDVFNIICVEQVNATDEELKNAKERFENDPFSKLFGW